MNVHVKNPAMVPAANQNELKCFEFQKAGFRVAVLDGEPWFLATDLYLYLFDPTTGVSARTYLEKDEQRVIMKVSAPDALTPLFTSGRYRLAFISESGLYKLILRSDKPIAKPFQNWVTKEVLPAIRKDGGYVLGEEKVKTGEMGEEEFILKAMQMMQRKIDRRGTSRAVC